MALRVPVVEVLHEVLARRPHAVGAAVRRAVPPERLAPVGAAVQPVGVVERVRGLVPQQLHAQLVRGAFGLEHLVVLELRQPPVREVERHREAGRAFGREPVDRQVDVRAEDEAGAVQFVV